MGKVSQIVTGSLVSALLVGGAVSATDATISNTGPNSYNSIRDSSGNYCTVTNTNDVDIDNDTDQTAGSGDAEVSGNTSGGSATSGSASNTNVFDVGVDITNGNACLPEENVPPVTPVTPVTPPSGGQGGGQVSGVTTTQVLGGRGAGEFQQVSAPVGGVGAGSGGSVLTTLIGSIAAMAYGGLRLKRYADADRL